MVTLQSVQGHTGLTHPFQFFWHTGTLALRTDWAAECPYVKKLKTAGRTSMALNALVDSFLLQSQKAWVWKG